MDYRVNDKQLTASVFLSFVNQIWPGSYDAERTQEALSRTQNITAYDGTKMGRMPAHSFGRLLFRDDHGIACTSGISE